MKSMTMIYLDKHFNGVHNVMKFNKGFSYELFDLKSLMTWTVSLIYQKFHTTLNLIFNRVSYVSSDITSTPLIIVILHVFSSLPQPYSLSHESISNSIPFHSHRFRRLCHCPQHRPRSQLHIPPLPPKSHYEPAILQRALTYAISCSKEAF